VLERQNTFPGERQRTRQRWSLLIREVADRSELFAEMSDEDRARSVQVAIEEALDLGRALGFSPEECRQEVHKLFH
jgi:hypothetical protein